MREFYVDSRRLLEAHRNAQSADQSDVLCWVHRVVDLTLESTAIIAEAESTGQTELI